MNNLRLDNKEIAKYAIIAGDINRAKIIAEKLEDYKAVSMNREYVVHEGVWKDKRIVVVATGIGAPAAAIVVEELMKKGVNCIIRVGTSGAINHSIKIGDIIVATAAYRDEGTTKQYIYPEFPAVADYCVVNSIVETAKKNSVDIIMGIVHTKDALAIETPESIPVSDDIERKWRILEKANVLVTEMECAALFVLASIYGIKAGAIIVSQD